MIFALLLASNQPYIDSLKEKYPEKYQLDSSGIIEKIRPTVPEDKSFGYTDVLKDELYKEDIEKNKSNGNKSLEQNYTENEREKLEPSDDTSAIQLVNEGRSELKLKRPGKIRNSFGIKMATVSMSRNLKINSTGRKFSDVYGKGWAPDVALSYEWKPFYSEIFGNFGALFTTGMFYFSGVGRFQFNLRNPANTNTFGTASQTVFQFIGIPALVGAIYRLNLPYVFRPFVSAQGGVIGYFETRSDSKSGNRGYSSVGVASVGVAFLLDWISRDSTWNLYRDQSVKHYYLTAEYQHTNTFSGPVDFNLSGIYSGFTFEF